jgi:hypothetical protein
MEQPAESENRAAAGRSIAFSILLLAPPVDIAGVVLFGILRN